MECFFNTDWILNIERLKKYTEIYRDIKKYTEIYRDIKKYTEIYRDIKKYTEIYYYCIYLSLRTSLETRENSDAMRE